jgi:hypothetical protein
VAATGTDPFEHPDAQRRFRVVEDVEELARALEYPWEKWTVFLHPAQRDTVVREYSGPARVSGSAGTGKTIVALHRAVHLARTHDDARVLLTTFSPALARNLRTRLRRLIGEEPRLAERIDVQALDDVAVRLHERALGSVNLAPASAVNEALRDGAATAGLQRFSAGFLRAEWHDVVDSLADTVMGRVPRRLAPRPPCAAAGSAAAGAMARVRGRAGAAGGAGEVHHDGAGVRSADRALLVRPAHALRLRRRR